MKMEQLERAKAIQACIEVEKYNIDHMKQFGKCKELIIMNNSEEVQKAIKDIYYSRTEPAPRYATGDDIEILVNALNKPRTDRLKNLQDEFDRL
jgi:hypothetical protein